MPRKSKGPDYRENHRKLKKLGILDGRLKKGGNYTAQEKRKISTLYNKFSKQADWADKPHQHRNGKKVTYSSRQLNSRSEIKAAKESGLEVYGNKVLIKHRADQKIRLVRHANHLSKGKKYLHVERRTGRVVRKDVIAPKIDLLEMLERMGDKKVSEVADASRVTVRIGENNPWNKAHMKYENLLKYITNTGEPGKGWELNDLKEGTEYAKEKKRYELIEEMTLVYIK